MSKTAAAFFINNNTGTCDLNLLTGRRIYNCCVTILFGGGAVLGALNYLGVLHYYLLPRGT